jgi:uncharacterized repeat protein (TIGR01451 family)
MRLRYSAFVLLSLAAIAALTLAAPAPVLAGLTPTPTETPTAPLPPRPPTATPGAAATPLPIVLDPLITKRANLQQAQVGDLVDFTITATNPNDVPVDNVVVVDPLSLLVDFISATTTQGTFTFDPATNTLVFTIGTMAPHQEVVITVQTRVNDFGQPPDLISNTATLTSSATPSTVSSSVVIVQLVPGLLPGAGVAPEPSPWPSLILAALAASLPLLFWRAARRRSR